jgi:glutamine synthetase
MKELDTELWKLGISSRTKHNEAAPSQHELAPIFETTNIAVDHNLLTMEYMRRLAPKYGMACLLAEKPFEGINGSGKHNNWSLSTDTGKNLLKPGKHPAENKQFLLVLSAVIRAVDKYQDLLRISAATAGNDCRLGGHEAPPAIISIFLGEELEELVQSIIDCRKYEEGERKYMSFGVASVPAFRKDTTDRNRTSPFAFTGNKFEFRMVGSSQNIALANIVLNTAVAEALCDAADKLEAAECFEEALNEVIRENLAKHSRILFSGNSYSKEWEIEAGARGLSNFKTSPEAYAHFTDDKNVALFGRFGVMSETEMKSRREIFFESYRKIKNIEAKTMLEMAIRDFIPAVSAYLSELTLSITRRREALKNALPSCEEDIAEKLTSLLNKTYDAYTALLKVQTRAAAIECEEEAAFFYKDKVIPKMDALRKSVDAMEVLCDRAVWPMPTYGDITFRI